MKKLAYSLLAFSILGLTACNDDDNDFSFESSVSVPTLLSFAKLDVELMLLVQIQALSSKAQMAYFRHLKDSQYKVFQVH